MTKQLAVDFKLNSPDECFEPANIIQAAKVLLYESATTPNDKVFCTRLILMPLAEGTPQYLLSVRTSKTFPAVGEWGITPIGYIIESGYQDYLGTLKEVCNTPPKSFLRHPSVNPKRL